MASLKQHILLKFNRAAIGLNTIRMSIMLGLHAVRRVVVVGSYNLRRKLTPRRIAVIAVLAMMLAAPAVMYLVERSHHADTRRAFASLAMSSGAETEFLRGSVRDLLLEQSRLTNLLLDDGHTIHNGAHVTVKVVATGYSSTVWQTDASPFTTASNTRTREGVVAMSRDLLARYTPGAPFDFGDRVQIPGLGYFIVEDSMNRRWDNRIDIWFPSVVEARAFGKRSVYLTRAAEESDLQTPEESTTETEAVAVSGL